MIEKLYYLPVQPQQVGEGKFNFEQARARTEALYLLLEEMPLAAKAGMYRLDQEGVLLPVRLL